MSLITVPRPEAELEGLVYGRLGSLEGARRKPWLFAALILVGLIVLNVAFY